MSEHANSTILRVAEAEPFLGCEVCEEPGPWAACDNCGTILCPSCDDTEEHEMLDGLAVSK